MVLVYHRGTQPLNHSFPGSLAFPSSPLSLREGGNKRDPKIENENETFPQISEVWKAQRPETWESFFYLFMFL